MDTRLASSVENLSQTAKNKLSGLSQSAAERIERSRAGAAETLENAAAAVRTKGAETGDAIAGLAGKTATNLDAPTRHVRSVSLGEVWSDTVEWARQHPGAVAVSAIVAGYCAGRLVPRRTPTGQAQDV